MKSSMLSEMLLLDFSLFPVFSCERCFWANHCFISDINIRMSERHAVCFLYWFSFLCFSPSQACTGIDNIAEAITLLELNNWDLVVSSLSAGFGLLSLTDRCCPPRVQVQEGSWHPITHSFVMAKLLPQHALLNRLHLERTIYRSDREGWRLLRGVAE